jgi:hypothetical protein
MNAKFYFIFIMILLSNFSCSQEKHKQKDEVVLFITMYTLKVPDFIPPFG